MSRFYRLCWHCSMSLCWFGRTLESRLFALCGFIAVYIFNDNLVRAEVLHTTSDDAGVYAEKRIWSSKLVELKKTILLLLQTPVFRILTITDIRLCRHLCTEALPIYRDKVRLWIVLSKCPTLTSISQFWASRWWGLELAVWIRCMVSYFIPVFKLHQIFETCQSKCPSWNG